MTHSSDKSLVILGCDIAKETIVICNRSTDEFKTIANRKQAIRHFLKPFQDGNVFGICEATGGYESLLL
ncbi:hypothetical protein, partial [Terasakiella brassicae]|uniref:hypothetical protein n=1 Tax=Terasakiella brassicae TaxID=1634917 RepID=UPI001E56BCC7